MMNVVHLWYNSVITLRSKTFQEEDLLFPPELNVQMKLYFSKHFINFGNYLLY